MNSLTVALISFAALSLGYFLYGRFLKRYWEIDESRPTPGQKYHDGVDYVCAKNWFVLFGHHFASIAGAGPILGPVIAAIAWGWFPVAIWIVLGSILLGGVHDFSALMASVKYQGRSIAEVSEKVGTPRLRLLFTWFIFLTLILVVAVFAAVAANTLVSMPELVIPTFALVGIAILVGFFVYRWHWNLAIATVIGIVLVVISLLAGFHWPIAINLPVPGQQIIWILILMVYAYVASVIPVNILLQPRDYISSFILFFGLITGIIGLFLTHPQMHTPAFISWHSHSGPLWPMLMVTVACGAISGFHSLVASGTTSKQLPNEKDALKIGYGGMITEGALAILALVSVCAGLAWTRGQGIPVYSELMKDGDWIVTFAEGFGQLTKPLFGAAGTAVAAVMLNSFVLTTLDTATRINRYILEEISLSWRFIQRPHQKKQKETNEPENWSGGATTINPYTSTTIVVGLSILLAIGNWSLIWPVFGAANQQVAALALITVSLVLLNMGKSAWITIYPAILMLATTIGALIYQGIGFFKANNWLLGIISLVLLFLAIFVCIEAISVVKRWKTA